MKVTMIRPDDLHAHFRDGALMRAVVPATARHFGRAVVMPNVPAIHTGEEASSYQSRIVAAAGDGAFTPLMTIKLTHQTTPETIRDAVHHGVIAAKLYPSGVTTASHDGIRDVRLLWPVLAEMQKQGMVLCIHGEQPGSFVLDRERDYLSTVADIVRNFPGLRVVLEHITTREAVDFVRAASVNVAATITAHHLAITLDDVLGAGIRPHLFCYPVAKTPDDLCTLRSAALYQNGGRFMFGSDTAPHVRSAKESACGCAGIYSAPVALAVLAEVFLGDEQREWDLQWRRDALERFTSTIGADFYGLPRNEGTITLERKDWRVPGSYLVAEAGMGVGVDVIPFRAGETLHWQVGESA